MSSDTTIPGLPSTLFGQILRKHPTCRIVVFFVQAKENQSNQAETMANQADVGQALQGAGVNVFNLKVKDIGTMTAVYGSVASEDDKRKADEAIEAKVGKISNHLEV